MTKSSLTLKSYHVDENGKEIAVYRCQHSQVGAHGTTLSFDVVLTRSGHMCEWEASIDFSECTGPTVAKSLLRLAEWAGRAAEALQVSEDWEINDVLPKGRIK